MKARAHLLIDGRVQGVFFRAFTRDVARSLGLDGWVRNLHDGRVEAIFEGDKALIEKAIQQCYQGPPYARVSDVDITWEDRLEGLTGFSVRY
ncbi:MAG: acylphosphatase [Chloroflexota bacterium]